MKSNIQSNEGLAVLKCSLCGKEAYETEFHVVGDVDLCNYCYGWDE